MIEEDGIPGCQARADCRREERLPGLRVFLGEDRNRPRDMTVEVDCPDEWLLAPLWRWFESTEIKPPFEPYKAENTATKVQLLRCILEDHTDESEPLTIWWEPATDTFWKARAGDKRRGPRHSRLRATIFPSFKDGLSI